MGRRNAFETHDFYCMCCGNKGIPLPRQLSFKKGKEHRKVLYCPYCQKRVNHIECATLAEVEKFKEDFENGLYVNEAAAELAFAELHGE